LATASNLVERDFMTLQLVALVVLGLMCGSELNVAAFAHPTLNR
jgi:hypothetical protein